MIKEELIEMARKAGGIDLTNTRANVTVWLGTGTFEFLDAFAKLVAEKEREECAKDCESMNSVEDYYGERIELFCAEAIRARGQE